jgi:hypothetical protein
MVTSSLVPASRRAMTDEALDPPRPDASAGLIEAADWHETAEKRLREEADILYRENRFSEAQTREIQATIHGTSAKHFRSRAADRSGKQPRHDASSGLIEAADALSYAATCLEDAGWYNAAEHCRRAEMKARAADRSEGRIAALEARVEALGRM